MPYRDLVAQTEELTGFKALELVQVVFAKSFMIVTRTNRNTLADYLQTSEPDSPSS
jgi:hypothetical protein